MNRLALVLVLCLAAPLPALAHNVIASVFPSGASVEGEIGFSNGDMAENTLIEVFDPDGSKLGETMTDGDGFFTYTPTVPVTHVFRADLGGGHVAKVEMAADEIGEILGEPVIQDAAPVQPAAAASTAAVPVAAAAGGVMLAAMTPEEKAEIAAIVRKEMRPLRQEISAYKNHNNLQTVLGGIGYIAGLFGLGFYLAARRRMAG